MIARICNWGNSRGVRIPKAFVEELGLHHQSVVDLSLRKGCLVMIPVQAPRRTLHSLLKSITEENLHPEISTGDARGREFLS